MLFIMLTGKLPFYGEFEDDLYRRIVLGKYAFPEYMPGNNGEVVS